MPGLRKTRKARKFKFDRNRKRVQKSMEATKNKNIRVADDILKANWDTNKALKTNMREMGLAFDANQVVKIASTKQQFIQRAKGNLKFENGELVEDEPEKAPKKDTEVVRALETEANNEDGRMKTYRFPKEDVRFITYMMRRHGDDFKAMARDPKNLFQLTPKQIRQKVVKFCSIPEQLAEATKDQGGILDKANELIEQMDKNFEDDDSD